MFSLLSVPETVRRSQQRGRSALPVRERDAAVPCASAAILPKTECLCVVVLQQIASGRSSSCSSPSRSGRLSSPRGSSRGKSPGRKLRGVGFFSSTFRRKEEEPPSGLEAVVGSALSKEAGKPARLAALGLANNGLGDRGAKLIVECLRRGPTVSAAPPPRIDIPAEVFLHERSVLVFECLRDCVVQGPTSGLVALHLGGNNLTDLGASVRVQRLHSASRRMFQRC